MDKQDFHRMGLWLAITLVLLAAIAATAPQLLAVDLHKVSLIALGAWLGYWIDRGLFPYARPDRSLLRHEAALRRAIIVAAVILGVSLGA